LSIPEEIRRFAEHLIWPRACPFCGALGRSACVLCLLPLLEPPLPMELGSLPLWSGGEHDGILRELILALKYGGDRTLGAEMGRALGRIFPCPGADILVPVPLHRRSCRAYNQSLALAEGLSKEWGLPVRDALSWKEHRSAQTSLAEAERKKMPDDVFQFRPGILSGRRAVLVDDVATTGTTFLRAARAVERAGGKVGLALSWTCSTRTKDGMRSVR
jgi:predicted amidophosphoribosyltransferase